MSAFNPNNKKLTPQEWQIIAQESNSETNAQYLIIGGIVGGGFLASVTGFAPTGLIFGAWALYNAFATTKSQNRNDTAISEYGCVAHVLRGDEFQDFLSQVGEEEVRRQLEWASDRNYKLSADALDFLENFSSKPTLTASTDEEKTYSPVQALRANVGSLMGGISNQIRRDKPDHDLIEAISERVRNHLIIGSPGSGKGIIISNALIAIKKKHPDTTVFYIDPKGEEKEAGYFQAVDVLKSESTANWKVSKTIEWFKAAIREFQEIPGSKLLVFDEASHTSKILALGKEGNWLKSILSAFTSLTDGSGVNIWYVCQDSSIKDLGFNSSGARSLFKGLAIVRHNEPTFYKALIETKWLPNEVRLSNDEIREICTQSKVARCYYYELFNQWLPMERLDNLSGFDRDTRSFLKGHEPKVKDSPVGTITLTEKDKKLIIYLESLPSGYESLFSGINNPTEERKQKFVDTVKELLQKCDRMDLINKFELS